MSAEQRLKEEKETIAQIEKLALEVERTWNEWLELPNTFPTTEFLGAIDELVTTCLGRDLKGIS